MTACRIPDFYLTLAARAAGLRAAPELSSAEGPMDRFIRRKNIEHFQRLLETVTEEAERDRILKLLAEEREKQLESGDSRD